MITQLVGIYLDVIEHAYVVYTEAERFIATVIML